MRCTEERLIPPALAMARPVQFYKLLHGKSELRDSLSAQRNNFSRGHMDCADFFDLPVRRRQWLLAKALECAPLAEALQFAQAAEAFLAAPEQTSVSTRVHPNSSVIIAPTSTRVH